MSQHSDYPYVSVVCSVYPLGQQSQSQTNKGPKYLELTMPVPNMYIVYPSKLSLNSNVEQPFPYIDTVLCISHIEMIFAHRRCAYLLGKCSDTKGLKQNYGTLEDARIHVPKIPRGDCTPLSIQSHN